MKPILTFDSFYPQAKKMRAHFDEQFAEQKNPKNNRFVWDYWHVPDQYTLMRTPAYHYFPKKMYEEFHSSLVQWGRENLGCHDISPTWLSYYVDGCKQELHSDVPHGPWAFVFSLTPWAQRKFIGGETLVLRPEVLNYWQNFLENRDHELSSFVERVPSKFNRLTVFDPRLPHGVTEVRGVRDPREARLVIHGWFVEPRPYVVGGLSTNDVQKAMQPALMNLQRAILATGDFHGTLSFRLQVSTNGHVKKFEWLTNTLVSVEGQPQALKKILTEIKSIFVNAEFTKKKSESKITIPLLFK